jgi:hypothetical protein
MVAHALVAVEAAEPNSESGEQYPSTTLLHVLTLDYNKLHIRAMALVAVWMLAVVLSVAIIVLQCTSVVTAGCLTKQLEDQFSASPPSSLEFYMHNPGLFTSFPSSGGVQQVAVRRSRKALKSSIITFDNKLTKGSDERSVEMGRAQGIRVVDEVGKGGPDELACSWHFTASFQGGRNGDGFNGTLSFQGTTHNFPSPAFSEITVTGGTGVFRFARGYATFNNFYKEEEISTLEGQHFQVFLRY